MDRKNHLWFWIRYYYNHIKAFMWFTIGFFIAFVLAYNMIVIKGLSSSAELKCTRISYASVEQIICREIKK